VPENFSDHRLKAKNMIDFKCANCRTILSVPDSPAGESETCPACKTGQIAPDIPVVGIIKIRCIHCQELHSVSSSLVGKQIPCKFCKKPILVPHVETEIQWVAAPITAGGMSLIIIAEF